MFQIVVKKTIFFYFNYIDNWNNLISLILVWLFYS
jgi:hypothetical protein